ncbi:MAG: thiamine-phosphate kinase [Acidobacteriota bacterium]
MLDGEDRLIAWLRRLDPQAPIGDDAAVLPSDAWAVTVDSQIAGVHLVEPVDPALLARRLLAVNLSDLAAMGAQPAYVFVALNGPPSFDRRACLRALRDALRPHAIQLAGGDLARHPTVSATLTALGRRASDGRWLRRDGGRPGDVVWLGGTVGEAAVGLELVLCGARLRGARVALPPDVAAWPRAHRRAARRAVRRHQRPTPQLALGRWLATSTPRGAAIDVSDGVARDLHRLCRASGVGATIDAARLPAPAGLAALARQRAASGDASIAHRQLHGGEDYVLLFTLPEDVEPPASCGCHAIGRLHGRRAGVRLRQPDGRVVPLAPDGWDHLGA